MTSHSPFDEAVAAYALGALDGDERRAFEVHLTSCLRCQQELATLTRVTTGLGLVVDPVAPPDSLKAQTLARAVASSSGQPMAGSPARPAAPSLLTPWFAAAAGLVLSVGLALYAVSLRSQVTDLRTVVADASARTETLRSELAAVRRDSARLINTVNVLSAPNVIRVDLRGQPGAESAAGRAYMSARGLIFSVDRLPALPAGRIYQLWVIPAGAAPVSAGVFVVDASGASTVQTSLPETARPIKTIAVTVESAPGGSPGPTSPVLLAGTAGD